jgi:hypothetical protein
MLSTITQTVISVTQSTELAIRMICRPTKCTPTLT